MSTPPLDTPASTTLTGSPRTSTAQTPDLLARSAERGTETAAPEDPFLWLEELDSKRAMEWVLGQNARTEAELFDADYAATQQEILKVLDAADRIPMVTKRGDHYYNFWRDSQHPKGLWRRTGWESYRQDDPAWEVLLDVDALAATEGIDWVFSGAQMLRPAPGDEYVRALVKLSPDGGDQVRVQG